MSSRFYERDDIYRFEHIDDEGTYDVEVDEDNFILHLHRDFNYMDRASMLDTRDEQYWAWYRADMDEEDFEMLEYIGKSVGTVLLRSTPISDIENQFADAHCVTDDELAHLLEESDEAE